MLKINVKGQTVQTGQESAHKRTDTHTDATKRIIAHATRSIKIEADMQTQIAYIEARENGKPNFSWKKQKKRNF